jgi:hypothetical protein
MLLLLNPQTSLGAFSSVKYSLDSAEKPFMILVLLLFSLFSFASDTVCNVRVNLPGGFREHLPRFRGHGFEVNSSARERVVVQGELAIGGVRLSRLIIFKNLRGELVEVDRVNSQFMQGLPSMIISRALPIIQRECAQSLVADSQELCDYQAPMVKEEKSFTRSLASCDIMELADSVVSECQSQGYRFCFPDTQDYEPDLTQEFMFRGTNCRVVVNGEKLYSDQEQQQIRCDKLRDCLVEFTSSPQLNTEFRRASLQRVASINQCDLSLGVNQPEREAETDTPASAAPRNRSRVRPQ